MISIHEAKDVIEADLIRNYLTENGIECLTQGYHHRSQLGFLGAYIPIQIMVAEEQESTARELLTQFNQTFSSEESV